MDKNIDFGYEAVAQIQRSNFRILLDASFDWAWYFSKLHLTIWIYR